MSDHDDGAWHLDKKVPLALLFAIAVQSGVFIAWGSSLNERVAQLERSAVAAAPQSDRLVRVETKLEAIGDAITEIKNLIRSAPRRSDQ